MSHNRHVLKTDALPYLSLTQGNVDTLQTALKAGCSSAFAQWDT